MRLVTRTLMSGNAKKIVIVGGVAGGASSATKARRVSEEVEITVFEAGRYVSYANCGIPYNLGKIIPARESLLLNDPKKFKERYNVDVHVQHRVEKINREKKTITVQPTDGDVMEVPYDKLILAPGAGAIMPWDNARRARNVHNVKTISDLDRIKAYMKEAADEGRPVRNVTVVGAGFIGVETCENMLSLGLHVSLVEMAPHIVPPVDADMAFELQAVMEEHGVHITTGDGVKEFVVEDGVASKIVLASGKEMTSDLFLVGLGVRPNIKLALEAGLETNRGIVVDEFMRTSDHDIFAAGDVCETLHLVTKQREVIALAGPGNKQGRVAGANAAGAEPPLVYKGALGTAIVGFKDYALGCTGINEEKAQRMGFKYSVIVQHHNDHAGYMPGAQNLMLKLLVEDGSNLILGAQVFGQHGVDKRVDVFATAIFAGLKANDLADLDLAYAPQFGSARDPVIMMGLGAQDVTGGDECLVTVSKFREERAKNAAVRVYDVRSPQEYAQGHVPGAVNIPIENLRLCLDQFPRHEPCFVYCLAGFRAYLATRILVQHGVKVCNIAGGWHSLKLPLAAANEIEK